MLSSRFRVLVLALGVVLGATACGDKGEPATTSAAPTASTAPASAAKVADNAPLYASGSESQSKSVAETLKKKYPTLPVADIKRLNIPGKVAMFEFTAGPQVAYTNEDVDFLLVGGEMLSGSGEQTVNLTQKSMSVKMADAYKRIPTEGALRYVFGNGQRQIVVFSDPECPYCQALEFMFETNKDNLNATVLIVPYPIESLHPQAEAKSKYLLCTQDPEKSWRDWMLTSAAAMSKNQAPSWEAWAARNPSKAGCARADLVAKVKAYGQEYGFNQTPILMFSNGMPFLGMIERGELERAWEFVRTGQVPPQ